MSEEHEKLVRFQQAAPRIMEVWQSPVYCTALEKQRSRDRPVSSNLTASTKFDHIGSFQQIYFITL